MSIRVLRFATQLLMKDV